MKDNAESIVDRVEPPPPAELSDRALDAAMHYVAERGVTSVVNMGTFDDLATFERAHHAGRMITRIYAVTPIAQWERLRDTVAARGRGDAWLRIGGIKGFVDGSLGSHTAAMFAPFTDSPADSGLLVETPEDLHRWTRDADRAGLQVIVHAIGDRAINLQLNIYGQVETENGPRDRRFRIEHAQHILPADIPRFAQLGVIASMQPYHAIDDGRWAESDRPGASEDHVCVPLAAGIPGARWRSEATGSSRRRRRSKGSMPRSRGGRSTTRIPAAGFRSRRSAWRTRCALTRVAARSRRSRRESRDRSSAESSPIWC